MATGAYPSNSSSNAVAVGVTSQANFIPELWSNEIEAEYQSQLVFRNAVKVMNHRGQKGDTVHIPTPARQAANVKAEHDAVTLINNAETEVQILLDKHYEHSRLIEDIAAVQGISSQRSFYNEDSAYSIAKQIDTSIWSQASALGTSDGALDYDGAVIGSDGSTAYNSGSSNEAPLADGGIRKMIQTLDDNDCPMSERSLLIPPVERNNLMGLARFTEQAYVGEVAGSNTIRNGVIGNLYGVTVRVSSNSPYPDDADTRACVLLHKSAICLVEQVGVRVQAQYKLEHLATLLTADAVWGVKAIRFNPASAQGQAGVVAVVPA